MGLRLKGRNRGNKRKKDKSSWRITSKQSKNNQIQDLIQTLQFPSNHAQSTETKMVRLDNTQ